MIQNQQSFNAGLNSTDRRPRSRWQWLPLSALVVGGLCLTTACSSVQLQSRTNPQTPVVTPIRSAVVVVVDDRGEVRSACENRFVNSLKTRGVKASASYEQFALADLKLGPEQIRQKLKAWNAEAAIVTRLVDRNSYSSGPNWSGGLIGPSTTWFDVDQFRMSMYGSGPEMRTAVQLETRMYRLDDGALVWTALTGMTIGENADRLEKIDQVIGKLVGQLAKDQVIP